MAKTQETLEPKYSEPINAPANGATPGRRRRVIIPIVVVLVIIGAIFGIRYLVYAAHHVSTDDAQLSGDITTIAPRVKGQVAAVYVSDNQTVRKGDKLVQLDPRDLQVAVDQAQAALSQAIASDNAARTGVPLQSAITAAQTTQAQAGIDQAQGQVSAAQARVANTAAGVAAALQKVSAAQSQADAAAAAATKARRDVTRAQELVAEGAIAQSQFDAAKAAADSAAANESAAMHNIEVSRSGVDQARQDALAAQAALAQAEAGVSGSNAQLMQAETGTQQTTIKSAQAATASAQVKAARATLAAAQLQLSYATIRAPIDGIVSKKSVNIGDNVASGQPVLAIASTTRLWVTANLKETQIANVRPGQPVDVKVDAFPGHIFTGKVQSLSPATGATFALIPPDNASGNFTKVVQRLSARIPIDPSSDPDHLLKQGLSTEVSIDTSNR
jgi:membrane fusion protein (multidrug efflux system)